MGNLAIALITAAALAIPATGLAQTQELKRDPVWNGVVVGATVGASVGFVVSQTTDEICSAGVCAALAATVGGVVGLFVDRGVGGSQVVKPGSLVDDSFTNGALIGASVGAGVVLIDVLRRCGTGPGRVTCTATGVLRDTVRGAAFIALVGLLIDAAIPSRSPVTTTAGETSARRHLSLAISLRF